MPGRFDDAEFFDSVTLSTVMQSIQSFGLTDWGTTCTHLQRLHHFGGAARR
jgi:hypothetical protein